MSSSSNGNWMKGAVKHPGALRKKAKAAGAVDKNGNIKPSWLNKKSKDPTTQRQKNLAKTFKKMRGGK